MPWLAAEALLLCHCGIQEYLDRNHSSAAMEVDAVRLAALIVRAVNSHDELLAALKQVLIGGNHLATIIGDHPPHTAAHDEALKYYGPSDAYEAWCCWRTIMEARLAIARAEVVNE